MKPLRVLVVEDNDDDAFLLLRELKRSGYATEHRQVCTPEDLNAALAAGPWDVVFSDWNMPRFNGLAAYRMTREKGLDVPFIIVSGTIAEDIAVEALKAGVHDFMTKGKFARLGPALERELREASIRQQRRDADAKLARQQREMEQSARLLRLVIDSVPDAIAVVDRQGHFTTWNAAAADLLDIETWSLAPSEWAKTTGFYHPNRTTQFPADRLPLARALRGESVDSEAIFFRTATHTAGRWLSVNARPLLDDNREVVGAVAAFRDVTNEREQNEKLMISDRMASLGMLAAGVGHEINNPLAAVVANLELAHRATLDAPTEVANAPRDELLEMLSDARAAADQVRQIVRDLRVLARNEESTLSAVNVERVLESSVRLAWNEIRHRARLEKDFKNPAQALASESRLGQVFLNLLVNARDAIGERKRGQIRVSCACDDVLGDDAPGDEREIVVSVRDTGRGMSDATLARVLEPFFTTKEVGKGTGIGLATV
ncbi:MAG: response regulator, partial [Myxococcales bacterium]|nr:response regulator [Myxococcales bacterium]